MRKETGGMQALNEGPILAIEKLICSYETRKEVLRIPKLEIYAGEKIAVVGANGAGKSTFFLHLNGVMTARYGTICYRGVPVGNKNRKELRKKIGIVFQEAEHQMIASTVKAEVSFGPMNLKLSKEEVADRVEQALAYMNITALGDRPLHYLSGGEKKRVSIADIIAMEPEIILFDEPTASLDPVNVSLLEGVLQRLEQEHKTLMISTHDVDFAYRFADRVLVFSRGEIIADAAPEEVFAREDVLKSASLKKPLLFEVAQLLEEKGCLGRAAGEQETAGEKWYPKTLEELRERMLDQCP